MENIGQKDLMLIGSVITALASKHECTRQHVRNLMTGKTKPKTIKSLKILADARAINEILKRETIITI